jgi:tryptophan synthase alpha chain
VNRIEQKFMDLKERKETALVTYVTAGAPDLDRTGRIVEVLERAGADILELGIPFSDPTADGPVIQAASRRALKAGTSLEGVLGLVSEMRRRSEMPVVLFGYYNPIHSYGPERFAREAARAGVDGVLVVDLPFEEAEELRRYTDPAGISFITLVAPTTGEERARKLARHASGFLYYISVTGVTGTKKPSVGHIEQDVLKVRGLSPVPVAVGFGITTPEQARDLAALADGVVVGSALVDLIHRKWGKPGGESDIFAFASGLKKALTPISDPV